MSAADLMAMRAEALFVSELQPSDNPTHTELRAAIVHTIRAKGGYSACAALMADEYGRHPVEAADRMRWALAQAATIAGSKAAELREELAGHTPDVAMAVMVIDPTSGPSAPAWVDTVRDLRSRLTLPSL